MALLHLTPQPSGIFFAYFHAPTVYGLLDIEEKSSL